MPQPSSQLLSIGDFSRASGLTVKALRHYHERGVLHPSSVDPETGYRSYCAALVPRAQLIRRLRGYDFPVDAIEEILTGCEDDADALEYLTQHQAQIEDKIRRFQAISASLQGIISKENEARVREQQSGFEIEDKELPTQLVAGLRTVGSFQQASELFGRLGKAFALHRAGKPGMLIYDSEYKEEAADFEPFFPLKRARGGAGASVRELSGGRALCLLHRGAYDTVSRSYGRLFQEISRRGLKALLPSRECYIKGPGVLFRGNPERYLTELQVLVAEP